MLPRIGRRQLHSSAMINAQVLVHRVNMRVSAATVSACADLLSDEERARAARFQQEADYRRFVVTRANLRRLLAHELALDAKAVKFEFGANEKPLLHSSLGATLFFNQTHCEDLALIAITTVPVGIDLEIRRPIEDLLDLAEQNFADEEIQCILRAENHHRNELFLRCWTRKEAFTKATGDGIASHLKQFVVCLDRDDTSLLRLSYRLPERNTDYRVIHLEPAPGYLGALVVATHSQIHPQDPSQDDLRAGGVTWRYAACVGEQRP